MENKSSLNPYSERSVNASKYGSRKRETRKTVRSSEAFNIVRAELEASEALKEAQTREKAQARYNKAVKSAAALNEAGKETAPAQTLSGTGKDAAPAEALSGAGKDAARAETLSGAGKDAASAESLSGAGNVTAPAEAFSGSGKETAPEEALNDAGKDAAPAQTSSEADKAVSMPETLSEAGAAADTEGKEAKSEEALLKADAEQNTAEAKEKAANTDNITQEQADKQAAADSKNDSADKEKEEYQMPSRKASFRKKVDELKQIDYKEKLESLKETGAQTAENLVQTTKEMSKTEAGQKVILKTRKAERFFKSKKGKRVIFAAVVVIALLIGFGKWRTGADLREGLKLCEEGNYVDAQTPLLNAVAKETKNPKAYNTLGMAYLGSGDYSDAIKQFELAGNLDKENQETYRGLGIAYYYTGKYEEAVTALDKALDLCRLNVNNTEYDIMWYRGKCECAMKDYEGAVYTYSALLELEGDSALLRYYRGNVYCMMNDKEKAMEDFDAAIAMPGNGYDLFFSIYNSMSAEGWNDEANAYLEKTMDSGYVDTSTVQDNTQQSKAEGIICYLQGNYEEALEHFSVNGLESDLEALEYQGLCYEGLGKTKKALEIYTQLVTDYPYAADAYNAMALYLMRAGKYKKAVSYLEQGIENCPAADQEVLYYNIVTAYESKGDMEEALDALRQYGVIYGQSSISHEKSFVKERDRS